ncbi:hypothetical protein [Oceanobacillus profundus]|uniref:hypothetical protein n=1 Tax=Oceanobacillus profundus TaxID=372463 RepID=UPI0036293374
MDGYGIIDGSNETIGHIESGRISLRKVTKILLLSDGLALPVNELEQDSWLLSARIAFDEGLKSLLGEVEKREAEDPNCRMYPRLKQRDDKTGLLLELLL